MNRFICPLVTSLLGCVLGTWICHKLFDKPRSVPRTRNLVPPADDDTESIVEIRDTSPAHFLTKIESFSLFFDHGIDKYETKEFAAGDYKWRLIIYPCGKEKDNEHVSVYLAMAETSSLPVDWEFNAIFTIFLYNQISDNYLCFRLNGGRRFNKTKSDWGFPKFIAMEVFEDKSNGYLVDDNFVLGAEVFVLERQRVIESVTVLKPKIYPHTRDWMIEEFSKLENVWESEEFTIRDIKWKVKLYPNGHSASKGREVSIFLVCVSADDHKKIKADYSLRLMGLSRCGVTSTIKSSSWFTSACKSWGCEDFISLDILLNPENGILVNDCLNLQVEISVQLVVV